MMTASYFTFLGPGRVGITAGNPRTIGGYRLYRTLAPRREMLKMPYAEYREHYDAILRDLDPRVTWDKLHELAEGHEPILLCWERPPFSPENYCHRRMVADWFKATLDEDVPEFGVGLVGVFGEKP